MSKSKFSKQVQKTISSCYKKGLTTVQTAERVNRLKCVQNNDLIISKRSIATIFGNIKRNRCSWHQ